MDQNKQKENEVLNPREKDILRLRQEGHTLEKIAKMYNITRERVRQIEQRAMRKSERAVLRECKEKSKIEIMTLLKYFFKSGYTLNIEQINELAEVDTRFKIIKEWLDK